MAFKIGLLSVLAGFALLISSHQNEATIAFLLASCLLMWRGKNVRFQVIGVVCTGMCLCYLGYLILHG